MDSNSNPEPLTADLPVATGPFPGVTRRQTAFTFRKRRRCIQLPLPNGVDLTSLAGQAVMLLIDDSGSMFMPGADKDGLRYTAAASVADLLRRLDVAALGVVHWGSYCPADLTLRPTTPMNVRGVDMALRAPASPLGGTNLSAALQYAHAVAQLDVPHLMPNYLVITDGLESVGRSLEKTLAILPSRSVRVLLVDRAKKCDHHTEQRWRSLPLSAFLRLDANDPDEWAWAAAVALFANLQTAYPHLPGQTQRKYLW